MLVRDTLANLLENGFDTVERLRCMPQRAGRHAPWHLQGHCSDAARQRPKTGRGRRRKSHEARRFYAAQVIAGHVLERAGLVILPEFQGLGIGPKLSEFVIQVC